MIEKGRSNNTSLYALLLTVFVVLAGTAFGIYTLLFTNDKQQVADAPAAPTTKVEQKLTPKNSQESNQVMPKAEAAEQHNYSILIKKSEFKLKVLDNGNVIETFGCALGKNTGDKEKSGDMKTPNGTFKVIEVCDASYWTHDFKDGKGEIKGAYGPWFFYLDTNEKSKGQWDGIGIHGTHDPASIGTLASEGCIRLLNDNVELLKTKYIKVGTMVTIEE